MTVALVLAAQPDAGPLGEQLRGQLAALGVRRVDAAERAGAGLLTVAAAARAAGERVLICVGDDSVPEEALTRLLDAGGTAAFTGPPSHDGNHTGGALVVDPSDLGALAAAAEALARRRAAPAEFSALLGELTERAVAVRFLDTGPDGDGAVVRWIADPVARDVARWAAGRQLAPASLLGISLGLGLLGVAWFTEPAVRADALAVLILLVAFVAGRAAAQLTAIERGTPAVGWLAAATGLLTEFGVYAALAVSSGLAGQTATTGQAGTPGQTGLYGMFGGSLRNTMVATWAGGGQVGLWRLAVAAMLLLGARRLAEVCYEGVARASGNPFPRPARRLAGQVITLPAGERIAVIAVTAIFFGPRLTFVALLAWGAVAAGYVVASQLAAAGKLTGADGEPARPRGVLNAYRGDGPIAYRIGGVVQGQLPPLPPLLVGLLVTGDLAFLGFSNLPGVLIFGPVVAMLLAALGARHPHDGRLDWLVPSLLLTGEGVFLAGLGFARHVWLPVVFALLAAVITRHADLAYRARAGKGLARDKYGLGWDGRMLLAGLAAVIGIVPLAFAALTAWLWLLAAWDFLGAWLKTNLDRHAAVDGQRGAGDERALVAGQEQHGPGHLLRRRVPAKRDQFLERNGSPGRVKPGSGDLDAVLELVVDRTGMDRVHPDAARRGLLGQRAHQPDQRVLGGGVGHDPRCRGQADHAGGDHDARAGAQVRQGVFAHQERTSHVHGHDLVEDVLRVVGHRGDDPADPRVGDHHVQPAERLGRSRHRRLDLPRIGHVGHRPAGPGTERRSAGLQLGSDQADQADPGPGGHEGPGRGHADAALAAGDDGGLPAQQVHIADAHALGRRSSCTPAHAP
jgi:hypothetical protein